MFIYIFSKGKGIATTLVGVATVIIPELVFSILDFPLSSNGLLLAQLLGLLAISFGVSAFLLTKDRTFSKKDCLINVLTDSVSAILLCNAFIQNSIGLGGLLLIAFYLFSAGGFLFSFYHLNIGRSHIGETI